MNAPFAMPTTKPPPRETVLARLATLNVLREGDHLVYTSGKHGHDYFEKNRLLADPYAAAGVAFHLAQSIIRTFEGGALIIGPASAGIGLSQLVTDAAARMHPRADYRAMYADKKGKDASGREIFAIERNASFLRDENLPIVLTEDVFTTGVSVGGVKKAVEDLGRQVNAMRVICNRGVSAEQLGVADLWAFLDLNLPKYDAEVCPLCATGQPINDELGHGATFVKQHGQPPYVRG